MSVPRGLQEKAPPDQRVYPLQGLERVWTSVSQSERSSVSCAAHTFELRVSQGLATRTKNHDGHASAEIVLGHPIRPSP